MKGASERYAVLALGALAAFCTGIAAQYLFGLVPCPLCVVQRGLFLVLAVTAVAATWQPAFGFLPLAISLAGLSVAGYQSWIQTFASSTTCSGKLAWWEIAVDWLGTVAPWAFKAMGSCSDKALSVMGLSLANLSMAAFGMALLLVWSAIRSKTPLRSSRPE